MTSTLTFVERLPQGAGARAPVIVLLHGWGMYHGHLFDMAQSFDRDWHLISPRAPVRMGPGAYRWFNFVRTPADGPNIDHDEERASLRTLIAYLEGVARRAGVDGVYLIGHSQGGTMALSVALSRPDLVKGCANVNGRILDKVWDAVCGARPLEGIPFFNGHGTENPIVPIRLGRATCTRLRTLGADLTTLEYPIGHEITPQALSDVSAWLGGVLIRASAGEREARVG